MSNPQANVLFLPKLDEEKRPTWIDDWLGDDPHLSQYSLQRIDELIEWSRELETILQSREERLKYLVQENLKYRGEKR